MMCIIVCLFELINSLLFISSQLSVKLGFKMNKVNGLIATVLLSAVPLFAQAKALEVKVYNADSHSFHVNSTLVYGDTEAVVFDAGFTKADAMRIAANVLDSGKNLTKIFVSQADPDYYFGAETLKQIFPKAQILATPKVRQVIAKKMQAKLGYWAPKMGDNAPKSPVLPTAFNQSSFTIDGYKVEIKGTDGLLAHRPYIWIPSIKAIIGNVAIYGGLHAWTADTQTVDQLSSWKQQLTQMQDLKPQIVVPGHMSAESKTNAENISYTLHYLNVFEQSKANSKNAEGLINDMSTSFPKAQLPIALNIGAKVHMGEMKW